VNLLDCAAVAIPAGFRKDGLPAGVTLVAPAFADDALAALADRLHRAAPFGMGPDRAAPLAGEALRPSRDGLLEIAVVGAHLTGMPLNHQLTSRNGVLLRKTRTAAAYRLFALPNTTPPKPGLMSEPGYAGPGLEVEIWGLSEAHFGAFVESIPAPMGIGKLKLADGREVSGFICEPYAFQGAEDITSFGGWRAYVESRRS
jgi:allophanate hydrolase